MCDNIFELFQDTHCESITQIEKNIIFDAYLFYMNCLIDIANENGLDETNETVQFNEIYTKISEITGKGFKNPDDNIYTIYFYFKKVIAYLNDIVKEYETYLSSFENINLNEIYDIKNTYTTTETGKQNIKNRIQLKDLNIILIIFQSTSKAFFKAQTL